MANGIDVSAIDFSKPRVRYKGKVQAVGGKTLFY